MRSAGLRNTDGNGRCSRFSFCCQYSDFRHVMIVESREKKNRKKTLENKVAAFVLFLSERLFISVLVS